MGWMQQNIKSKVCLDEVLGINILKMKGQMETACVRSYLSYDIWSMATCHEINKYGSEG